MKSGVVAVLEMTLSKVGNLMGRLDRLLSLGIAYTFVFGVFYIVYSFATAEERMKKLCAQIPPRTQYEKLVETAKAHGLFGPQSRDGINFMVEMKTFGRFGCKVWINRGLVEKVEYNFAD